MARALRAWAIKGRKKLSPQLAVRTEHSANKRYLMNRIIDFCTAVSQYASSLFFMDLIKTIIKTVILVSGPKAAEIVVIL